MLLPEELEIIMQAFKEIMEKKPGKIFFENVEYTPEALLNEMQNQTELGLKFAEYLKDKGLEELGVMQQSDLFLSLSFKVRMEPGLLAFFMAPNGLIYTSEDVANELLLKTDFGKQFAKTLLKVAFGSMM